MVRDGEGGASCVSHNTLLIVRKPPTGAVPPARCGAKPRGRADGSRRETQTSESVCDF